MDLWALLPVGWRLGLESHKSEIARIGQFLTDQQALGLQVNPSNEHIFAALPDTPEEVRVIILGQDPYPNPQHATGLAFAVPNGTRPLPPTLRNISAELKADVGAELTDTDLESWRGQGVLLLNSVLTTEAGRSLAHQDLGWQLITTAIIRTVVSVNPDVVAVLWGRQAQQLAIEFNPQFVIAGPHPSPLSAYRGFFGSRPFSRVNELLELTSQDEIIW